MGVQRPVLRELFAGARKDEATRLFYVVEVSTLSSFSALSHVAVGYVTGREHGHCTKPAPFILIGSFSQQVKED